MTPALSPHATSSEPDYLLVAAIRRGGDEGRSAFDALVRRHYDRVHRTAMAWLRNHADADDVTQETFIKIFRHVERFEFRSSFSTWLVRIARNECATFVSRRARHSPDEHLIALIRIAKFGAPEDDFETGGLERLLQPLNAADQDLLRLRFLYDLSLNEIAVRYGIGRSAAKMRLHRALGKLRERFDIGELAAFSTT